MKLHYDTGVSVEPSQGYYTEIYPRSSLSKTGYILHNSVGIIDPTYRGTLKIALLRVDDSRGELKLPFTKAQLVVRQMVPSDIEVVHNLSSSYRGDGAYGSTD